MARCERTLHVENRHQARVVDVGLLVRGNRSLLRAEGLGVSGVVAVLRLYQAIAGLLVLIVTFVAVLLLDVDMHVGLRAHAAALDLLVQEGLLFEIYKLVIRVAIFVRIVACFVAVGFDHIARVHWGLNCIRDDLLIFALDFFFAPRYSSSKHELPIAVDLLAFRDLRLQPNVTPV